MTLLPLSLARGLRVHSVHGLLTVFALATAVPATMRAQEAAAAQAAPLRADSLSGKWQARGRNPAYAGNLLMILMLVQRGDTVAGTVVLEYNQQASESPVDLIGTIHDGRVDLLARLNVMRIVGTLRNGKLEARIVPGRAAEQSAFAMTFTRVE